jgi:hypothetical protein
MPATTRLLKIKIEEELPYFFSTRVKNLLMQKIKEKFDNNPFLMNEEARFRYLCNLSKRIIAFYISSEGDILCDKSLEKKLEDYRKEYLPHHLNNDELLESLKKIYSDAKKIEEYCPKDCSHDGKMGLLMANFKLDKLEKQTSMKMLDDGQSIVCQIMKIDDILEDICSFDKEKLNDNSFVEKIKYFLSVSLSKNNTDDDNKQKRVIDMLNIESRFIVKFDMENSEKIFFAVVLDGLKTFATVLASLFIASSALSVGAFTPPVLLFSAAAASVIRCGESFIFSNKYDYSNLLTEIDGLQETYRTRNQL